MRHFGFTTLFLLLMGAAGAYAQRGEVGVAVGGSLYRNPSITNGSQSVTAGLDSGFSGSAWLGQDMYKYVGGEIRYTYERNDFKLSGNGANVGFSGYAQVINYDLLVHLSPRGSRVRPYVLGGGGVKFYKGTGTESATQPLSRYALLTRANELTGVVSFGAGVKFNVSKHLNVRGEFRDYLSGYPHKVVTSNVNSSSPGLLHNFVPSIGLAYTY